MNHNAYYQAFEHAPDFYRPETPALIEPRLPAPGQPLEHRVISYGDLLASGTRLAARLAASGVAPGDRVLLMVPMSIALYQAMMATLKCGAVCLFIDPADGIAQLDRTAGRLAPRAFIGTPEAQRLRMVCPSVARIPLALTSTDLDSGGDGSFATVARELEDPAIITFTSGSSGTPKGVRRTHGDLRAQFRMLSLHEGKKLRGVNLCAFPILPIDDISAGRTSLLAAFRPGRAAEADPALLLDQVRQFPPALVSVPPGMLERMLAAARAQGTRLDTVRHAYTGGGPVSLAALHLAREVMPQAEVHVVYGSTEAEPVAMISAAEVLSETADRTARGEGACVGQPAPEVSVRIAEDGEVQVAGPHVNRAYFENEEETRRNKVTDAAGVVWHRMGDTGYRDAQGRLWLTGRLAHRVATPAGVLEVGRIEPQLASVNGVRRAALVGVPVVRSGVPEVAAAALLELEPGVDRVPVMRAARMLVEERGLAIPWLQDVPAIPLDRRIGAKIQYAQLLEKYGPLIRQALSDPFGGRFSTYLAERFPPGPTLVAALVFAIGVGSVAVNPWWGSPLRLMAVTLVVFLFFFHLRAYDEQKDEVEDRVAHPERVIPRGIVTVHEVASMDQAGLLVQALLALALGLSSLFWWLCATAYAWLMRREFFVGELLRPSLVAYGLTHCVVILWLARFAQAGLAGEGSGAAWAIALVAAGLAFIQELSRKLDPSDADPSAKQVDRTWLTSRAFDRMAQLTAGVAAALALVVVAIGSGGWAFALGVALPALLSVSTCAQYVRKPSVKTAKAMHGTTLLLALIWYTLLATRPSWSLR